MPPGNVVFTINFLTYQLTRRLGPDALAVVRPTGVYLLDFFCSGIQFYVLLRPYLCFIYFLHLDLFVLGDDAWISWGLSCNQTYMCLDPHLN